MIVTTTRHGRTRRDSRCLLAHLSREDGQRSRVVHVAAPVATAPEALDYMQALRDGSRASVGYHHISLSPGQPLTDEQRDEAIIRVLRIFGAEDHAYAVWEHREKARRGCDVDTHYHVVVSHVGPDGRALDDSRSYVRLEAAARAMEHDWSHSVTPSRRPAAVALELERQGRPDVAARVRGEAPPEPPQSAMSSRQRARAERHGVSLPDVREAVRDAWSRSDSPAALRAALAERGLAVRVGDKPGVWVATTADGVTLGALDRLAGQRRRTVAARMQQETPSHDPADPAARHARSTGDLRRGPRRPGGGAGPGSASVPSRPTSAGGGQPVAGGDGPPRRDLQYAAGDPSGDRGVGRSPRRAGTALALAALTQTARGRDTRRDLRRLQRLHRPRGHDMLDARRLARVDLDELRRMAEAIGRRIAAFLTRLSPPAPHSSRPDPRDELRARLREAASRPRRAGAPVLRPESEKPVSALRPRF